MFNLRVKEIGIKMINLVTYDLRKPGRDYSSLYEAIKANSLSWAHPVESVWLIDTTTNPGDVRDYLKKHIDSNDVLFVIQLQQNWASSNLSTDIVDWLKKSSRNW